MKYIKFYISIIFSLIIIAIIIFHSSDTESKKTENINNQATLLKDKGKSDVTNKNELEKFLDITNFEIDNSRTYYNERFKFSVDYPITWEVISDNNVDDDPQNGIMIYIEDDKNNWIYVYGQDGHIVIPPEKLKEVFNTSNGNSGTIMYDNLEEEVNIYLVFDEEFYGATVNTNQEIFSKNSSKILGVLKSIKFEISD
ncbi:hypothetical protein [Vallitalea sp.]|uniref:hypothetical protein n=1 Tax=Vallitalea sp. TaxID=1882829 RepID=UPI0025D88787|nr:hypothetical protein [Vallitalea sp.]MCT4685822.1 hypothetical protein [Vallitalea sp.]